MLFITVYIYINFCSTCSVQCFFYIIKTDCQFLNWKARCATDVQPLGHVILKAKVNLCSKPVDVTVTFQVNIIIFVTILLVSRF